jgi:transglutaminase-like putative cysteine protease
MKFKTFISAFLLLITLTVFSQDNLYSALTIPKELKENANAVIRSHDIEIELHNYASMTVKSKRVITVLNKNGLNQLDSYIYYDPEINVKVISGIVYNAFGKEIKKFKKKDFKDYSASGGSLYSDNRVLSLDYTPIAYPFTFVFETETQTNSTAFFRRWYPIENYFMSTQRASYKIVNYENVPLDIKEFNIDLDGIENLSNENSIYYTARNLKAIKWESLSPSFSKIVPVVMVAPQKFRLVDVDGYAKNWDDFGKWNYNNLLIGRNNLPEKVKNDVANLVKGIEDPVEKAKIIYQYVQDKTRYISVQLGVGGWQPMLASKVDEISYGDCKALTNYTMSLLQSQNITAYYSVVYGDDDLRDIESDFIGMQGNHVILNIPNEGAPIWLECTSQKVPFGHIVNFTDDRDVLVITPEGGRIEHTRAYTSTENYLKSDANVTLYVNGGFEAEVVSKSGGSQYDDRLDRIVDSDQKDRVTYYKRYWGYINGLSLNAIDINNDKNKIEITEKINIKSPSYAVSAGDKLLIKPNMFNRLTNVPPRYSERKLPFVIQRGFFDEDKYIINLPEGYAIDALGEEKEIESQFGTYRASLTKLSDTQVTYKRSLEIVKGSYKKEDYNAYRSFRRKIAKADKTAFILNKTN